MHVHPTLAALRLLADTLTPHTRAALESCRDLDHDFLIDHARKVDPALAEPVAAYLSLYCRKTVVGPTTTLKVHRP